MCLLLHNAVILFFCIVRTCVHCMLHFHVLFSFTCACFFLNLCVLSCNVSQDMTQQVCNMFCLCVCLLRPGLWWYSNLVVGLSLDMVKDQSVFDAIMRFGVAGKPLDKHEEREVGRLAEVGKQVMEEAAFDLVKSAQKKPLLFSYCGDGTPLKVKSSFQIAFAEHHKHARSGYTGAELYCQGGFLRTLDDAGEPIVRALLKDPRPMDGKGALCAFNGLVEFFQH